jgi:hypothetical protein
VTHPNQNHVSVVPRGASVGGATLLEAALRYGKFGLRVFPLWWYGNPNENDENDPKIAGRPMIGAWPEKASSDADTIRGWWNRWPGAGIGLACGDELADGTFLFVLDVDEHDPAESGSQALSELVAAHGELPNGPLVHTAGGGSHRYLRASTKLTNARGTLPAGIDVRGAGGYVILPPSTHKSGGRHQWDVEHQLGDVRVPDAPDWLLDVLNGSADRPNPTTETTEDWKVLDDRPGTAWANRTSWDELLEADGWHSSGTGGAREELWVRPGKNPKDGPSATVNYGGADRLVVHSTNAPIPSDSYSKLGYIAAMHHGGDFFAAAKSVGMNNVRSHGALNVPTQNEPAASFRPVDLVPYLRGDYAQPVPDYLIRRGDDITSGMIYKAAVNGFHGDSGIGKSWLALYALAERIQDGDSVMLIDLEDGASSILSRLRLLGIAADQIAAQLHYVRPTDPYGPDEVAYLCGLVTKNDVTVCVIDSLGESFGLDGINENNDNEVGPWLRAVARPLADAGAAVILVDHVTKTNEKPLHASGSKRKRAAITGASYFIGAKKPFSKEDGGRLTITCAKDRHGTYRSGDAVAHLDMTYLADRTVRVELVAAAPAELTPNDAPSVLAARKVVDVLRASGSKLTLRKLNAEVRSDGFHASNQVISDGIELAKSRDCIVEEAGENRSRNFSYAKNWTGL